MSEIPSSDAKKKTICYIGNFFFPDGNAAGIRVRSNGRLFRKLGFETFYIGLTQDETAISRDGSFEVSDDGFRYQCLSYPTGLGGWIRFRKKLHFVTRQLEALNPSAIVVYGSLSSSVFSFFLYRWARKRHLTVITDCVDWLAGGVGGRLFRVAKRLDTEFQKRIVNAQADGVVTVSSYLQTYYRSRDCLTVVIPPLFTGTERSGTTKPQSGFSSRPIQLYYAGFPFAVGRGQIERRDFKDRLDSAIESLSACTEYDFEFNIFGVTKSMYLDAVPEHESLLEALSSRIIFHGKVSNSVALASLRRSDYVLLIRDVNKMTSAGFPSKIAEAVGMSIPVITTRTSDLEEYIEHGETGWLTDVSPDQDYSAVLREVLNQGSDRALEMGENCARSRPFSEDRFVDRVRVFFDKLGILE
ncbi:MAG: glycosyltransferase [Pseudomonadota bacterium]